MSKKRVVKVARSATQKALDNKERIRPFLKDEHYVTAVTALKVIRFIISKIDR